MVPLGIILAAALSAVDYITEHLVPKKVMSNQKMISFAAGVAVAYILLHLFPQIAGLSVVKGEILFLLVLAGFTLTHVLGRYMHISHHRTPLLKDYSHVHLTYFFLYNFLIGILLTRVGSQGLSQALLFFVPFLLYIAVETLPKEFHLKGKVTKILYAAAPLWGSIASSFFPQIPSFTTQHFPELISIVTGTLLYIVIRQSIPSNRESRPLYFVLGAVFYAIVLMWVTAF